MYTTVTDRSIYERYDSSPSGTSNRTDVKIQCERLFVHEQIREDGRRLSHSRLRRVSHPIQSDPHIATAHLPHSRAPLFTRPHSRTYSAAATAAATAPPTNPTYLAVAAGATFPVALLDAPALPDIVWLAAPEPEGIAEPDCVGLAEPDERALDAAEEAAELTFEETEASTDDTAWLC